VPSGYYEIEYWLINGSGRACVDSGFGDFFAEENFPETMMELVASIIAFAKHYLYHNQKKSQDSMRKNILFLLILLLGVLLLTCGCTENSTQETLKKGFSTSSLSPPDDVNPANEPTIISAQDSRTSVSQAPQTIAGTQTTRVEICGSVEIDPLTEGCCWGRNYDLETQGCCKGRVYNLHQNGLNMSCCGGTVYSPETNSQLKCVGGVFYDPAVSAWCFGKLYNTSTQGCCGYTVYDLQMNGLNMSCCGGIPYAPALRGCGPARYD
jgi:hypothetical protein